MLSGGGSGGAPRGWQGVVHVPVGAERAFEILRCHRRDENAAGARRVLAVDAAVTARSRELVAAGRRPERARIAALAEVAAEARCTLHVAEVHHLIGRLLDDHLPAVRDAAMAGLIDYARLAKIHHYVGDLEPELIRRLEIDILASARTHPPAALGRDLERLILAADPEAADVRRIRQQARRNVTRTPVRDGMENLRAYLPAADALVVDEAIDRIAGTCCPHDPRDAGNRRADAIVALALGQTRLACRCRRDDCTADPFEEAERAASGGVYGGGEPGGGESGAAGAAGGDGAAGAGAVGGDGAAGGDSAAAGESAAASSGMRGAAGVPGKPKAHVFVHVDLATLAHLTDAPAHLERHGPIATGYARVLAENATWQLLFTEARSLASRWCAANLGEAPAQCTCGAAGGGAAAGQDGAMAPDAGAPPGARTPSATGSGGEVCPQGADGPAGDPDDDGWACWRGADGYLDPDAADFSAGFATGPAPADPASPAASVGPDDLDDPDYLRFLEDQYRRYCLRQNALRRERLDLAAAAEGTAAQPGAAEPPGPLYGKVRQAPVTLLRHARLPSAQPVPVISDGLLADIIMSRVLDEPALADGIDPDGHSWWPAPPPGALVYRPRRGDASLVRLRDGHCRFPGCTIDADRCQLDHIVPFDHADPHAGGWSVPGNLHCLCRQHHQLKTSGFWRVVRLGGNAELWTSTITGQRMVGVPGGRRRLYDELARQVHPPIGRRRRAGCAAPRAGAADPFGSTPADCADAPF